MAILKECAPHAVGLLAGVGYEDDDPVSFGEGSKVVSEKGQVMDVVFEGEEGVTRCIKGYTVGPGPKLPEVLAARNGMRLFDESVEDYLSGKIRRYVSVMVVAGGNGEAMRSYRIKSRRLDRQYGRIGGDDFLDIVVIDAGGPVMNEVAGGPELIVPLCDFGLDAEATLKVLEEGLKTGFDRTMAVSVAEMKGYLKGYVEGRKGAEPSFDFARTVEEAGRKDAISLAEMVVAIHIGKKVPIEEPIDAMKLSDDQRAKVQREADRLMKALRASKCCKPRRRDGMRSRVSHRAGARLLLRYSLPSSVSSTHSDRFLERPIGPGILANPMSSRRTASSGRNAPSSLRASMTISPSRYDASTSGP